MRDFILMIGHKTIHPFEKIGQFIEFMGKSLYSCITPPYYPKLVIRQFFKIGFYSLPVVGLTAAFSGMVLALQSYSGFSRFSAEGAVATVVVISITRELGPVFAGLMVAGRVGAAMAAELGTMRVTEQIDALKTLNVNPFNYLVAPRMIASILMMPLLVLIADIIGVFGGFIVSTHELGFNPLLYIQKTFQYLETMDVVSGLIKAGFFGLFISGLGCYQGFSSSRGGAEGVGYATTQAVVSASVMVLLLNYLLTEFFFAH